MTGQEILDALEWIDPELIQAAERYSGNRLRKMAGFLALAAACIAIMMVVAGIVQYFLPKPDIHVEHTNPSQQTQPMQWQSGVCYLSLDVNPSVQLMIQENTVIQWQALNESAEQSQENLDLVGMNVKDAVSQLLQMLIANGYIHLDQEKSTLLLAACGDDAQWEVMRSAVEAAEETLLSNKAEAFVIIQQIEDSETVWKLAQKYGVSVGKMQYVLHLQKENPDIVLENAAQYSVDELFGMDQDRILDGTADEVGASKEYGEQLTYVGEAYSFLYSIDWKRLPPEVQKELLKMYSLEELEDQHRSTHWKEVPNMVGLMDDEVRDALIGTGLSIQVKYQNNSNARKNGFVDGQCFYQDIEAGHVHNPETAIIIHILCSCTDAPDLDNHLPAE